MKKSLILLLGVALSATACTGYVSGPVVAGPGYYGYGPAVAVAVEDRPYYVHGPRYISRGQPYRWVSGHYVRRNGQRYWVHGHYVGY